MTLEHVNKFFRENTIETGVGDEDIGPGRGSSAFPGHQRLASTVASSSFSKRSSAVFTCLIAFR